MLPLRENSGVKNCKTTVTLSVFYKFKILKFSTHQYKKTGCVELPQVQMRDPMIALLFPDYLVPLTGCV